MSRLFSPYQLNPLNYNPLQHVLEQAVDFDAAARELAPVKLFLSATNVRTGKVQGLHRRRRSRADAVLASACLPFMFQAVEIDGEAYWDGGYMGNPAHLPADLPLRQPRTSSSSTSTRSSGPDVPTTATEIMNRINEISFNSSLMREMRAIAFVTRLIDDGKLRDGDAEAHAASTRSRPTR